jgi:hypothetical protein
MSSHTVLAGLVASSTNHLSFCGPVASAPGCAASSGHERDERKYAESPAKHVLEIANECPIVNG